MNQITSTAGVNRRNFLLSSVKIGAGFAIAGLPLRSFIAADEPTPPTTSRSPTLRERSPDELLVGVIGAGEQGCILIEAMRHVPNTRVKAVCDIWQYPRDAALARLKKTGVIANGYENYREMLEKEKDIEAVIVATPDWMHASQTIAAMEAGKHVYCETEMANSLEQARQMVLAQRRTGKLLQIGRQRRSNPRYIYGIERLIHETKLFGRVTNAYSQWNRSKQTDRGWPERYPASSETLSKYGYESMQQLRNWRGFKQFGNSPFVELGTHQIDVLSWVFGAAPKSVIASGGIDFYKDQEWPDNVMAIFEFENKEGVARAFYQVQTTTGYGAFQEIFMGENGSLRLSETPALGNAAIPEGSAFRRFELAVDQGLLLPLPKQLLSQNRIRECFVDSRASKAFEGYPLPVQLKQPSHTPHLENFFDAIRNGRKLTCPAHEAYRTTTAVLMANEAVRAGRRIEFRPQDFIV